MEVPEDNPIQIFTDEINGSPTGVLLKELSGFTPQADFVLEEESIWIFHNYQDSPEAKWRIRWEPVKKRDDNDTELDEGEKQLFTCGAHLMAHTARPEILRYPDPPRPEGYDHDQHCRWTIGRPRFTSFKLRIVDLSMEKSTSLQPNDDGEWEEVETEQQGECEFDYLAISNKAVTQQEQHVIDTTRELESSMKLCRKDQINQNYTYAYSSELILHFISDRSRGGQGFAVEYSLDCNSFDHIPATTKGFRDVLTSPKYPNNYPDSKNCGWNIIFRSNRRVQVEIVDLDIEDSPNCAADKLMIASSPHYMRGQIKNNIICGTMSKFNEITRKLVFNNGKVFIRFDTDSKNNGRGFKLIISEIIEECSGSIIALSEAVPNISLHSPQWPQWVPSSAECSWTIRAPAGHRVSFTVDPDHFEMQNDNSNTTCEGGDFMEVRDGSSFHSPLIGRYCGIHSPSTIFSTGSYLHVSMATDSDRFSHGFNATAALAQCGGTIVLKEGENTTLTSPNYPEAYPNKGNCTWTIRAPNTHFVEAQLGHFFVQYSPNCTSDSLTIRDGNETGKALMNGWCGNSYSRGGPLKENNRKEFRSSRGIMTIVFLANSDIQRGNRLFCSEKKCGFSLTLWSSKTSCGGEISDTTGYLTTPGYPGRLMPRVECQWNLNAGPGKRYQLSIEFVDRHGFYLPAIHSFQRQPCFGDVEVVNLPEEYENAHYSLRQIFCQNKTEMITPTDVAMIRYSDLRARAIQRMSHIEVTDESLYQPFRIQYSKVPADIDTDGCQIVINDEGVKNHTFRIAPPEDWQTGTRSSQFDSSYHELFVCHISIRRSRKRKGTTSVTVKDFLFESPFEMNSCGAYSALVDMKASTSASSRTREFIPFNMKICNSTFGKIPAGNDKVVHKATIVPDIDMFVISPRSFMGKYLEFTLDVEFDVCGGHITNRDGESGLISSPGFDKGNNYPPNQHCQWVIEAPDGHTVTLRVKSMEIEFTYICHKDQLTLSEGEDATVVHRYCHNSNSQKNSNDSSLDERSQKFTSYSRIFVLDWRTDATVELAGWQLEYEFKRSNDTDDCGYITNAKHGVIRSPGAPDKDYANNLECIWDIQVPDGYVIALHYKMMDIERATDCANDALTISEEHRDRGWAPNEYYYFIFDKSHAHSPYCDITAPADFKTESNRIRFNFTTNEKIVGRGFELEYRAVCGGVYQLSHGVLTSPHYPDYVPNEDMECDYFINPEVSPGVTQVVTIAINDIQLSDGLIHYRRDPCPSDYFQVIDAERKTVIYTYCPFDRQGEQRNLSFSIKGPIGIKLFVNKTYNVESGNKLVRGFKLTWALNRCGGEWALNSARTGYSTTFYSPGYPLDYHDELDCAWTFKTSPDRVFSVKIKKLDIENEDNCLLDKLEIHNGGVETNSSLIGKYCGHSAPNSRIYIMNNTMLVRFVTDHSMSHSGFLMEVTASLGPQAGCGGTLEASGDWKTFSSPTVNTTGVAQYPPDLRCGWTIKGLPNTMIELRVSKLKTERPQEGHVLRSGKKCLDFIAIYDGYKAYSPLIESDLCEHSGLTLPKLYHTSNRIAHVYFESDHSIEDEGFTMDYRSGTPTCGGWLRATKDKQMINYAVTRDPKEGQSYERCRWVIASNIQAPIWVRITTIKFPMSDCKEDFVEIRDVGIVQECEHPGCALRQEQKKTVRECGVKGQGVAPFVSNTLAVQVSSAAKLIPDAATTLKIEYYVLDVCNRTVDARFLASSRLTSPHFPRPYGHNHSCETFIQADDKKRILLVFRTFDMEHPAAKYDHEDGTIRNECIHDYLEINDASKAKKDAPRHCGIAVPHPYLSAGNVVSLFLQTDESVVGDGYDLSYYTADFMDEKTIIFSQNNELQGAIQQPNYPGYESSVSYKWFVHPPAGHKCKLTIEEINLNLRTGEDAKCGESEKLTITLTLNDEKAESTLDTCNLTEEEMLPIIVEFTGEIVITFESDAEKDNDGRGFRATWMCDDYETKDV